MVNACFYRQAAYCTVLCCANTRPVCSHQGDHEVYEMDKEAEARLISYICVAALLVEPGACLAPAQTSALADELKMSLQDLVARFRWAGWP